MQAAVYSRKSRITGIGESIENQAELCRQFVRQQYGEDAAQALLYFEDEGFSGGNLDRPQFQKMMQQVRKKEITLIVCYRLDRISRSIGDFAGLMQELERLGVTFVSIREQFDTHSPMGRAMMYIASVFSQLERETIAERIRDNMHALARDGRWLGGTVPLGFASRRFTCEKDGRTHSFSMLEPVPEELEQVRFLFREFLQEKNLSGLCRQTAELGWKTVRDKPFTRYALRGILRNPVYAAADADTWAYFAERGAVLTGFRDTFDGSCGLMVYNRTLQKRGRAQKQKPVREWIVTCGGHPAAISGAEWVAVQQIFAQRKKAENGYPGS